MENTSIVTVGKPQFGFSCIYFKEIQNLDHLYNSG